MPEGPSIVILKEEVQQFTVQEVIAVSGNSKKAGASIFWSASRDLHCGYTFCYSGLIG